MTGVSTFKPGDYRYIRGPFQYSAGVMAEPGFTLQRVRFAEPVPVAQGFERIEAHLAAAGRPLGAFCACELRSPGQFSDQGFIDFNRQYVATLERWGIFRDDDNPVARSNVCPEGRGPSEPGFAAFTYTVPDTSNSNRPAFVIAGSGEARETNQPYSERTVRHGDTTADGMREKACFVLDVMQQRMAEFEVTWNDVTATQVYTVFDLYPFLADEMVSRGAIPHGLTWYYARPPVRGLDFEMDVRRVPAEFVID
jgi:hypothetical protein